MNHGTLIGDYFLHIGAVVVAANLLQLTGYLELLRGETLAMLR
jgi:hypothetical protein